MLWDCHLHQVDPCCIQGSHTLSSLLEAFCWGTCCWGNFCCGNYYWGCCWELMDNWGLPIRSCALMAVSTKPWKLESCWGGHRDIVLGQGGVVAEEVVGREDCWDSNQPWLIWSALRGSLRLSLSYCGCCGARWWVGPVLSVFPDIDQRPTYL